jgi:DNA-binding CsgD family transcriptional regulator
MTTSQQRARRVMRDRALSKREIEVLALMAQGLPNGKIGDRLYVAENTIKSHVSTLLLRLGATNRAHAVSLAYQQGVLPVVSDDWLSTLRPALRDVALHPVTVALLRLENSGHPVICVSCWHCGHLDDPHFAANREGHRKAVSLAQHHALTRHGLGDNGVVDTITKNN